MSSVVTCSNEQTAERSECVNEAMHVDHMLANSIRIVIVILSLWCNQEKMYNSVLSPRSTENFVANCSFTAIQIVVLLPIYKCGSITDRLFRNDYT